MQSLEQNIKKLKPTYTVDFVFLTIGLAGLVAGFILSNLVFSVGGGIIAILGVLMFVKSHSGIRDYNFILENYKTSPEQALGILNKVIDQQKKSIAVDQRKADGGGKDSRDSANDVIRKTAKLEIMLAVKEHIKQYN
ncbi:hypothetical protein KQ51_01220 [Candidatus Izimaplasma bacterium HR1]|jgi:hypothetical protein|uniref:hypothetical protein n=1 Tax=Candidatus Izimoplasma sp. HR1 TaxID=1541959 RepID=UPI0004F74588|nr:hypothetical protein KQ51_01220 [Candidatus Izimaplasma bacterium HR1]